MEKRGSKYKGKKLREEKRTKTGKSKSEVEGGGNGKRER